MLNGLEDGADASDHEHAEADAPWPTSCLTKLGKGDREAFVTWLPRSLKTTGHESLALVMKVVKKGRRMRNLTKRPFPAGRSKKRLTS